VTLDSGETREFDHLIFGTGYRIDVARYPFLAPGIVDELDRQDGYPVLRRGLESSIAGLHFAGPTAAWSFGPVMRFISGSWYASGAMTRLIAGERAAAGRS
jgi:hypothetical protein